MPNPKLLLADDSIAIRKVVELTFADEGIDVFAVPDAQAAMQKFIEVQPDIVLIDAGLEGTSGYQICEMIKQDEQTRHIPVLLLVGSFEPFDKEAADRAGADGFLTKPFQSIRDLVKRVSELLGRGQPGETEQAAATEEPAEMVAAASAESMHAAPTIPSIDTADIEDLYESSFTETAEIEEFDTVEDVFDDDGLDDELIETTHPMMAGTSEEASLADTAVSADLGNLTVDEAATVKEFDWSPAAKVDETQATAVAAFETTESFFPATLPETLAEPERIEAVSDVASTEVPSRSEQHSREGKPPDDVRIIDKGPLTNAETALPTETPNAPTKEPDSRGEDGPGAEAGVVETAQVPDAFTEPASEVALPDEHDHVYPAVSDRESDPSPELIDLITQRVVERLSDRVIREVAQEAVPRIAEKLIREALEDERKG